MIERIEALKAFIWERKHYVFRRTPEQLGLDRMCETFKAEGVAPVERSARMLRALLEAEIPVILDGETIVATRTRSGPISVHITPFTSVARFPTYRPTMRVSFATA